ncbi:acyltransferase [Bordetella sp. FB-8]|uniref:acyltransferase family protein n=1 Tax=Bordetella sp. FB-8 TaxID=1159870 RepID=UPI000686C6BC|nr:acyltransferase [Bordetella sp. FB-8]
MATSAQSGRLGHIDAMRALAVLLVLWTHYAELYAPIAGAHQWLDTLQRVVDFGRIGVVMFFCISGVLIPTSLRGQPGGGTRRFLVRRFFRLYPAFWVSVPLGYLVYWTLFGNHLSGAGLVANLTMIPTAFGAQQVMGLYWTLETELYFYVLCLVLFWLGVLHRMRGLLLTSAVLLAAFVIAAMLHVIPDAAPGQYKGMLYHLAIMFWGACFRQAYVTPAARIGFRLGKWGLTLTYRAAVTLLAALIAAVALLMAAVYWHRHDDAHVFVSISYITGMGLFALFATVLKIRVRFLVWLGEISYSVYLLHGIPAYLLFWFCLVHGLVGAPLDIYMAAPLPVAIALSWACYRFIELKGIAFARRLTSGAEETGKRGLRYEK